MRHISHAIALLLTTFTPLTAAHAADRGYYAPAAPVQVAPVPVPAIPVPAVIPLPDRAHWVLIPDTSYAPISPLDYSLPNTEYNRRIQNAAPDCCYHTYYVPDYYR